MTKRPLRASAGSVALGLVLIAGSLVAGTSSANAAPQDYCQSGATCAWQDHSYLTDGNPADQTWFFQCYYAYWGKFVGSYSFYNNGNYDRAWFFSQPGYPWTLDGVWPRFYLDKKTGDGNIHNTEGYVKNISWNVQSARFDTVPVTCK